MITLNLVESYWRSHSENSNDETSPLSISRASKLSLNNNAVPPPVLPFLEWSSSLNPGRVISAL